MTLNLSDSYQSCDKGDTIKIGWTLSGGQSPYTLRITSLGDQTPSAGSGSVDYVCPNTARERELTLTVSDSSTPAQSISRTQTVNVRLPAYNFEARIRARLQDNGKVESCLHLRSTSTDDCIKPRFRLVTPSEMIDNRWYNSSTVYADYDGDDNRTLGQISARKATATANIELQFAGCGQLMRIAAFPAVLSLADGDAEHLAVDRLVHAHSER